MPFHKDAQIIYFVVSCRLVRPDRCCCRFLPMWSVLSVKTTVDQLPLALLFLLAHQRLAEEEVSQILMLLSGGNDQRYQFEMLSWMH
eukprot:4538401-Amphidinium_carterae.1